MESRKKGESKVDIKNPRALETTERSLKDTGYKFECPGIVGRTKVSMTTSVILSTVASVRSLQYRLLRDPKYQLSGAWAAVLRSAHSGARCNKLAWNQGATGSPVLSWKGGA